MKTSTPDLPGILTGSFQSKLVGDVMYGLERRLQDMPIETWSLTADITAEVKSGGQLTIAYQDDFARSVSPRDLGDALAPFGQEIHLYQVIQAGTFSERIPMGMYRIDEVPSSKDSRVKFAGGAVTLGSRVDVDLLDRFETVRRARYRSLTQPESLTSAWAELGRITRLQVTRNVADVAIPKSLVYDRDRLVNAQLIAKLLGGIAYMTVDGTVSILPFVHSAVALTLSVGDEGTIIDVPRSMASADVANVVVGDFETDAGLPIHVEAAITSGPLAVGGPFGEVVVDYPDDQKQFINDLASAQTAVNNHLSLVSAAASFEVEVVCLTNPLLELNDVVAAQESDRLVTGWVRKIQRSGGPTMTVTLGVISDVDTN